MTHGGGPWLAPGQKEGSGRGIFWIMGIVCLVGVLVIVGGIVALYVMLAQSKAQGSTSRASGPARSSAPGTPPADASPTDTSSIPESSTPSRERDSSFPAVRPAADLPPGERTLLGFEVSIEASDLRYRVMDAFGETIYNCLFSTDIRNLTDQPLAVTAEFRTAGAPHLTWDGSSPFELEPGESTERILGWDGLSAAEVGITESECAGPVELTRLVVAPG